MSAEGSPPAGVDADQVVALIRQARAGSTDAFTELVRLHQRPVRVYLGRHLQGRDVVDDLAQEVFIVAYEKLASYREESPFGSWLLGIARIRLLLFLRSTRRRRAREADARDELLMALSLERLEKEDPAPTRRERETAALEACLRGLPAHSAALLQEHYVRGRTATELARAQGKAAGALRMTLLRIRQALRACVERRLGEEGA